MAREIQKTTLNEDLLGDDSFDQPPDGDWPSLDEDPAKRATDGWEADLFEEDSGQERAQAGARRKPGSAGESSLLDSSYPVPRQKPLSVELSDGPQKTAASSKAKRVSAAKLALMGLTALLVVVLAGLTTAFLYKDRLLPKTNVEFIKHPIVIPSHKEQLDFLIVSSAQDAKGLTSFVLTFEFRAVNAHEQFRNNSLAIKDAVYHFLEQSRSSGGARPDWMKVVEKDLLAELRARFAQCRISSVRLTQIEDI